MSTSTTDARATGPAAPDTSPPLSCREYFLAKVTRDGRSLEHVPESYRADGEVVLAAVTQYGRALRYAADSCKADVAVVLAAVTQNGMAL